LGQINYNIQISNKIKRQLFGILNFGHCNLPFDLAQGGGELVEPFGICDLIFEIFLIAEVRTLTPLAQT
jgi:hypothetical protein